MTNRNSASPVPQASRAPWNYRHPRLFGLAVVTGLLAAGSGLAASIKIEVTVPLFVPLLAAASLIVLMDRAWQSFKAERRPVRAPVTWALAGYDDDLIGRDERDAVLNFLGERYSTEHLDEDEYGRRHTMVLNARHRGELRPALEGLSW